MDRRPGGHVLSATDRPLGDVVRTAAPAALGRLVRSGVEFAAAEDAVQDALLEALRSWPDRPPEDPAGWLTAVARRRLVDARRSESARRRREERVAEEPVPRPAERGDDTLLLLFCCCHPTLSPASQVALTLRAVGGLTTREVADAFFVPEATMAQRISRAKRTLRGHDLRTPGDLAVVLRVLALIDRTGHAQRRELAGEAVRLARQLARATAEPEARGLLALLLIQHARLPARIDAEGRLVRLDDQDRTRWSGAQIAEGVAVLQGALEDSRSGVRGRWQLLAAIAALHADASSYSETDWEQVLAWYDELLALSADPAHDDPGSVIDRAVAVGHVHGPQAGLAETDRVRDALGERDRWHAVRAYLHELGGDAPAAAAAYAAAAERSTVLLEREHLLRRAARARSRV